MYYGVSGRYFFKFWVSGRVEEPEKSDILSIELAQNMGRINGIGRSDRVSNLPERVTDESLNFSIRPFCVIITG